MGARLVLVDFGTCGVNHGSGRSSGKARTRKLEAGTVADEALVELFGFIQSR